MSAVKKFMPAKEDTITGYVAATCPFCNKVNELDVTGEFDKTCKHYSDMEWDRARFVFENSVEQ